MAWTERLETRSGKTKWSRRTRRSGKAEGIQERTRSTKRGEALLLLVAITLSFLMSFEAGSDRLGGDRGLPHAACGLFEVAYLFGTGQGGGRGEPQRTAVRTADRSREKVTPP